MALTILCPPISNSESSKNREIFSTGNESFTINATITNVAPTDREMMIFNHLPDFELCSFVSFGKCVKASKNNAFLIVSITSCVNSRSGSLNNMNNKAIEKPNSPFNIIDNKRLLLIVSVTAATIITAVKIHSSGAIGVVDQALIEKASVYQIVPPTETIKNK